ncbi:MAG: 2-phosphosulfolactate phosphatase [Salibacteraceae bacterium]
MPLIEVSYTPENFEVYDTTDSIVVVNDIFRATSAMCTAFENGAKSMIPVDTIEKARELQKKGYLAGAERNAEKVEGFDFGNSPYDYMGEHIKGKTLVLTTTNGTRAIEMAKGVSDTIVIGSFLNISALSQWLVKQKKNVLILCSGWKGRINLEDSLFAGALTKELIQDGIYSLEHDVEDSALIAMHLFEMAQKDPEKLLNVSSHRRRLAKLNLKEDIRYCLTLNTTSKIPILIEDELVDLETTEFY